MRGSMCRWTSFFAVVAMCAGTICLADGPDKKAGEFDDSAIEFFEKEVRPILTARCLECHGTGQGDPKGGLKLTSRAAVLQGGDTGPAVVPGKLKDSLLISAIEYGDLYQMPPKSKLPAKEIATLTKWVELGAPWPKETATAAGTGHGFDLATRKAAHWCWQPIARQPEPVTKDVHWPRTAVDRFILARLEEQQLSPAGPAEKSTLIRRVYFDLIGLPPTPDEVQSFVQDESPQALEQVVDRLLDSPQYGERWARHWLDLVRYAETRGHEFEPIIPNAWQYRDYVIRAINADVPYDRFLTEQIAGDLMEPRWRDQRLVKSDAANKSGVAQVAINEAPLGTGFWFLGEEVHSPVDIRKDETDRMDNRVDVMTKTFLGLTVGCARCHDHKFDAISQRDYYALIGYLISGSYRQIRVQSSESDRTIATSLDAVRAETRRNLATALVESAKPNLAHLDQYLAAARQLVAGGVVVEVSGSTSTRNEILFADFEGDNWGDWKAEGTAFGTRPQRKGDDPYDAPLEGFRGEHLANSHRTPATGSNTAGTRDAQTGKLTSPTFTVDHDTILFLIGGGAHPGRTCMNLTVDGKVVRTATGSNSGTLRTEKWQVGEFRGKKAEIEIVDAEPGGWGHILVDQIVFANAPAAERGLATHRRLTTESRKKAAEIAEQQRLNSDLLERWCVELVVAKSDPKHLLHRLVASSGGGAGTDSTKPAEPQGVIVNFATAGPSEVIQDGVSFGLRPVPAGQLQIDGSAVDPRLEVATVGGWTRDLFWKDQKLTPDAEDDYGGLGGWHRHGRVVRTPEFTLAADRVWYLVRGSVRAYACVNSHLVVGGPLHGGLLREFKQTDEQWHWVSHGLELYRGHRLHVEFTPVDDGACSIAMVVQAQDAPRLPDFAGTDATRSQLGPMPGQEKPWQEQFAAVLSRFIRAQDSTSNPFEMSAADATLSNWFLDRLQLFGVEDSQALVRTHVAALRAQETRLSTQVQWESQLAPAMLDGNGIDEHLLIRGNSNTPRDAVHRRFLEALESPQGSNPPPKGHSGESAVEEPSGSGRLELARRMLESPVAARVAVNRIWYHLFGRGIVPSVDNMGVLGQPPTHPELLDYLSAEFVKDGWSTKRLIKSLVLSRTYQMSSHPSEPADTQDPNNRFWHRMPIKRLEGEAIRDALLAVSGRLNPSSYGPSVPIHLTPFMEGRGRPGVSGPLDGNGRRSIYIAVRRNFLSPMMLAFDTPSPFSTVGRRTTSNVPAQALILMNDPLVIELSRQWANRLLAEPDRSAEQRIDAMFLSALARRPTDVEKGEAIRFLESQGARFGASERRELESPQAWADLCHVVFNLKEFIFIE